MTDDDARVSVSAFVPEPPSIPLLELQQDIADIAVLVAIAAFVGSDDPELGPNLYAPIDDLEVDYVAYGSPFVIDLTVIAQWAPLVSAAFAAGGGLGLLLRQIGQFIRDTAEADKLHEEAATIKHEREKSVAIDAMRAAANELGNTHAAGQIARLADEAEYVDPAQPEWVGSLIRLATKNARVESIDWADRKARPRRDAAPDEGYPSA